MGEQYPRSDFNEPTVEVILNELKVYKTMRISFSLPPVRGLLIHVDYRLREREREREREKVAQIHCTKHCHLILVH